LRKEDKLVTLVDDICNDIGFVERERLYSDLLYIEDNRHACYVTSIDSADTWNISLNFPDGQYTYKAYTYSHSFVHILGCYEFLNVTQPLYPQL
jgi:hypothetical protein